jgi:HSP20 family protein
MGEKVHPGLVHPWQWRLFSLLSSPTLSPATTLQPRRQPDHVSWEETAAAHPFSSNLPGN